jgi:hypothetical protein
VHPQGLFLSVTGLPGTDKRGIDFCDLPGGRTFHVDTEVVTQIEAARFRIQLNFVVWGERNFKLLVATVVTTGWGEILDRQAKNEEFPGPVVFSVTFQSGFKGLVDGGGVGVVPHPTSLLVHGANDVEIAAGRIVLTDFQFAT